MGKVHLRIIRLAILAIFLCTLSGNVLSQPAANAKFQLNDLWCHDPSEIGSDEIRLEGRTETGDWKVLYEGDFEEDKKADLKSIVREYKDTYEFRLVERDSDSPNDDFGSRAIGTEPGVREIIWKGTDAGNKYKYVLYVDVQKL